MWSVGKKPVIGLSLTLEPPATFLAVGLTWVGRRELLTAASALRRCERVWIAHGYFLALRCARLSGTSAVGRVRSVMNLMSGFHDASYNFVWS
jgi:hypothetical protein